MGDAAPGSCPLAYEAHGPADAAAVVLGSSLGTNRHMWDEQVTALARGEQPRRVIAFDHLGHGESEVPPGPYSIAQLADAVLAMLDELGIERADYVGLSLGGMVGMHLAIHSPDRIGRLVLCATAPHLPPAQVWRERAALVRSDGMASVVEATLGRWFTPGAAAARPATVELIREQILATDPDGYAACAEAVGAMDQRAGLARISAPTLAIAGAEDPTTSAELMAEWVPRIPGGRLVVLPGAHLVNLDDTAAFNAAMVAHLDAESGE